MRIAPQMRTDFGFDHHPKNEFPQVNWVRCCTEQSHLLGADLIKINENIVIDMSTEEYNDHLQHRPITCLVKKQNQNNNRDNPWL